MDVTAAFGMRIEHGAPDLFIYRALPKNTNQDGFCRSSISLFCCASESKFLMWISRDI
jgi:hypothetical protein